MPRRRSSRPDQTRPAIGFPAASGPDIHSHVRWCASGASTDHLLDGYLVELLAFRAAPDDDAVGGAR
ncbi:hypothetical protein [Streptomyces sp. CA-111067]|uniref:hypothetical protein n=1 Tax=Streptomyces sp. CA-111067 TaxID=3240046 RepID=UPI003D986AF5